MQMMQRWAKMLSFNMNQEDANEKLNETSFHAYQWVR